MKAPGDKHYMVSRPWQYKTITEYKKQSPRSTLDLILQEYLSGWLLKRSAEVFVRMPNKKKMQLLP